MTASRTGPDGQPTEPTEPTGPDEHHEHHEHHVGPLHLPPALDDDQEPPDPTEAVEYELHRKSATRRIVEALISITALIVLFAFVIPDVAGTTYREVAHELRRLSIAEIALLAVVWLIGLAAYAGVLSAALPGLRRTQSMVLNTASSSVSNVVPFGGAVGVGATYGMCRSWGFGVPTTTLGILVSGIWNFFLKLGLPVLALVLLVAAGGADGGLVGAAVVGLAVLVASVVALSLVLRSEKLAAQIGRGLQRAVSALLHALRRPPRAGIDEAVLEFRHRSRGLIASRWQRLTLWMLLYSLLQFALQLLCLRLLGEHSLSTVEVFAAFAFGRLLSTIPLTPSGVGIADATAVTALVKFGGDPHVCLTAVLLFTGFTYLLEIPVGAVSWGVWSRAKSWRRPLPA